MRECSMSIGPFGVIGLFFLIVLIVAIIGHFIEDWWNKGGPGGTIANI